MELLLKQFWLTTDIGVLAFEHPGWIGVIQPSVEALMILLIRIRAVGFDGVVKLLTEKGRLFGLVR